MSGLVSIRSEEYAARAELKDILEARGLTLDGQPAGVFGLCLDHATVRGLKVPGLSADYQWRTLELIAAKGEAALTT
jgi:hypothetical protein